MDTPSVSLNNEYKQDIIIYLKLNRLNTLAGKEQENGSDSEEWATMIGGLSRWGAPRLDSIFPCEGGTGQW